MQRTKILRRREEKDDMKQYDFMRNSDGSSGEEITVEHTPKRKLDLFPRIVCLLVAVGIWIFMVNVNDPNSTETMTLKLSIVGASDLADENGIPLTVLNMDKAEVTITVKGTNRDLKSFTAGDYRAVVDVSGVKKSGAITIPVKITTPANSSIKLDTQDVADVTVSLDLVAEKEIPITVGFAEDSVPVEGLEYEIGVDVDGVDLETLGNKIKIKGPKSVVDRITGASYIVKHGDQTAKYSTVVPTYTTDSAEAIDTSRVTCPDITVTVKVSSENEIESESGSEFESEN